MNSIFYWETPNSPYLGQYENEIAVNNRDEGK